MMKRCVQIGLGLLLAAAGLIVTAAVTIAAALPSAAIATVLFVCWKKEDANGRLV